MPNTMRIILTILIISLVFATTYSAFSGKNEFIPYIQLLMGVAFVVLGINEIRGEQRKFGIWSFVLAGLSFLAGILNLFI